MLRPCLHRGQGVDAVCTRNVKPQGALAFWVQGPTRLVGLAGVVFKWLTVTKFRFLPAFVPDWLDFSEAR